MLNYFVESIQTKPCVYQDPGERSNDTTRDWPRLVCECPEVSSGGVGWWCPAAGSGALSGTMHAWKLLKEVEIIFITSTVVWPQVKQEGRNTNLTHQQKIELKVYKRLYRKDLHDPDNTDGGITHLQPDILEWEVKWILENITTNKAKGCDGIPVELFQILKDDVVKVLLSICQQIWKTQQWPQDWKSQFSFQSQRKAMSKSVQTTTQLHSSHMLVK